MLAHLRSRRQAGDTIIEVLFAVTVFSLVVVLAISIMNQGTASARRTFEIAQVREEIDAQAETLRFLHESYVNVYSTGITFSDDENSPAKEYDKIINTVQATGRTAASQFTELTSCPSPAPEGAFALNTRTAQVRVDTSTLQRATANYAQVTYPAEENSPGTFRGIWIEGIRTLPTGASVGYIDFHIRACWLAPGLTRPMSMGTIVRLYEPRS
jgi:type II secretory pathway pseudopilin PulG